MIFHPDVDGDTIVQASESLADDERLAVEEMDEADEKQHSKAIFVHSCS